MDSYGLFIVADISGFADTLKQAFWQAYGPVIKVIGVIVLVFIAAPAVFGILRKLTR